MALGNIETTTTLARARTSVEGRRAPASGTHRAAATAALGPSTPQIYHSSKACEYHCQADKDKGYHTRRLHFYLLCRKMMRKSSRKSSRKASRRSSRKMMYGGKRKGSRRSSRKMMYGGKRKASRRSSCMMRGGKRKGSRKMMMYGGNPSAQSLAQGVEYGKIHAAQHGGAAVSLAAAAPVGYTGMLDESLRAIARVAPLDQAVGQIQGLSDQSGGARKRRRGLTARVGKAGKAVTRKLKMMRTSLMKMMRRMTKGRMMRGGAALTPAAYGTPGMLLPPAMEAKALAGMNPEWKLATDPAAFAPKML